MQQNPPAFDETTFRNGLVARHGRDIGTLIADATASRRKILDERFTELSTEHAAVMRQISERQAAAGKTQAEWQVRIGAAFAPYSALLEAAAADDIRAQGEMAALSAQRQSLQAQIRSIATPRLSERELQAVALYNSEGATLARHADIKLPPLDKPMSELARINLAGKLRS
jgi:hypothetical protein